MRNAAFGQNQNYLDTTNLSKTQKWLIQDNTIGEKYWIRPGKGLRQTQGGGMEFSGSKLGRVEGKKRKWSKIKDTKTRECYQYVSH